MWGSAPLVSPAGEDPLAERKCDLDSVAGVLKLYFRSLESPLVPIESTGQLLEHARTFAPCASKGQAEPAAAACLLSHLLVFLFFSPPPDPSEIRNEAERAAQLRAVISSFPEPVIIVMRYLFAFLHQ